MLLGSYQFNCRFTSDAHLPEYKGSTFRGVFGRALKQVVCALKRQECPSCLLKGECLYPAVFEPELAATADSGRPPHPYVIQPPADAQRFFEEGSPFDFNLLLFGPVNRRLPYFIYAFDRMGSIGIGKKIAGRRATFRLTSVDASGRTVYHHADQRLRVEDACEELGLRPDSPESERPRAIALTFETPLRLKHNNRLARELPFHVLVRAMLRRVSALLSAYGDGEPALDYAGMVERAQQVDIVRNDLVWEDWRRYSLRQDRAMQMGGLKGGITYAGDLGEFLPLIAFCAHVHLGKQTTFGLGRFRAEVGQ